MREFHWYQTVIPLGCSDIPHIFLAFYLCKERRKYPVLATRQHHLELTLKFIEETVQRYLTLLILTLISTNILESISGFITLEYKYNTQRKTEEEYTRWMFLWTQEDSIGLWFEHLKITFTLTFSGPMKMSSNYNNSYLVFHLISLFKHKIRISFPFHTWCCITRTTNVTDWVTQVPRRNMISSCKISDSVTAPKP